MKIAVALVAITTILGTCTREGMPMLIADDQMIEYKLRSGEFVVIVLFGPDHSIKDVKKAARQKAAVVTVSQGCRYFVIESETEVQAAKSSENLSQKDVIKGNSKPSSSNLTPAWRVVFRCYEKKPTGKNILDACDYTKCSKK